MFNPLCRASRVPKNPATKKPSTKSTGRHVDKPVESSARTNHRRRGEFPVKETQPRQPKLRSTPPRKPAPKDNRRKPEEETYEGQSKRASALRLAREKISAEVVESAAATGMLPHEWLLAVMRGEQINHYAYDAESSEIVEVIVLPTFADRMEAAKAAAPY